MRILTFDIGGTFVKSGIFDGHSLSDSKQIPTGMGCSASHILDILTDGARLALSSGPLDGIGISTRGQVDFDHGRIIFDPPEVIPGYTGLDLRQALQARLDLTGQEQFPVIVENDGNCAALAESIWGAARDFGDSLCVVFGTAIGGAIIHNKQLYRGSRYSAGEFGMMYFPSEDETALPYEQYASVTSLVEMALRTDPSMTDGKKITAALAGGDPSITEICHIWCRRAAIGLASLVHIFNPPCLVLGGGIMENESIADRIRTSCLSLLAPGFEHVEIRAAALGNKAGMLGAAYLTARCLPASLLPPFSLRCDGSEGI